MSNPEVITTTRLVVRDGYDRLIMAIRPLSSKQRPGDFDFFGGKLEIGEDPVSGVIRETFEETGMVIAPNKVSSLYEEHDEDGIKEFIRLYFLYDRRTPLSEIKSLPEHLGAVCVRPETALNLTEFIPHQRAISRLDQLAFA